MKLQVLALLGIVFVFGCEDTAVSPSNPTDTKNTDTVAIDSAKLQRQKILDSLMKPDSSGFQVDSRDGRIYPWVKVGQYKVMAKNLAYRPKSGNTSYNPYNDPAMAGLDSNKIIDSIGYAYDSAALYGDSTVKSNMGFQGVCPEGWFIPDLGDWDNLTLRPVIGTSRQGTNPSIQRIFNRWSISKDFGGKDSLQLHFAPTYGIDHDCDTSENIIGKLDNCKEVKRYFISYATMDIYRYASFGYYRFNSDPVDFFNRNDGLQLGNSYWKTDSSQFTYVRCFKVVER